MRCTTVHKPRSKARRLCPDHGDERLERISRVMASPLVADLDWDDAVLLATDSQAPPEVLLRLAHDKRGAVRKSVALNDNTPAEALDLFVGDPSDELVIFAAGHPNLSEDAQVMIAAPDQPYLARKALADRADLGWAARDRLASDKADQVAVAVLSSSGTPDDILRKHVRSPFPHYRRAIALNASASADSLTHLAADGFPSVRAAVAGNPSTPDGVLDRLREDDEQLPVADEARREIGRRLAERLGIAEDAHAALEFLTDRGWMSLTVESNAVKIAKRVYGAA